METKINLADKKTSVRNASAKKKVVPNPYAWKTWQEMSVSISYEEMEQRHADDGSINFDMLRGRAVTLIVDKVSDRDTFDRVIEALESAAPSHLQIIDNT